MISRLPALKFSERGSTTVLVLISVLALSVIGAALILAQKNLYIGSQKIENEQIQLDVSDLCVKAVIDDLKAKSSTNALVINPATRVTVSPVSPSSFFSSRVNSLYAPSAYKQYTSAFIQSCVYQFLLQRATQGTTTGGEINKTRAYLDTDGMEKIYEIQVITCESSACLSVRTESKIYVGIQ